MPKHFEVRGVPRGILLDAWWLNAETDPAGAQAGPTKGGGGGWFGMPGAASRQGIGLLWLVLLADVLFWRQEVGLSLAIFALAMVLASGAGLPLRSRIRGGLVCLIGVLPVMDHVQAQLCRKWAQLRTWCRIRPAIARPWPPRCGLNWARRIRPSRRRCAGQRRANAP